MNHYFQYLESLNVKVKRRKAPFNKFKAQDDFIEISYFSKTGHRFCNKGSIYLIPTFEKVE